METVAEVLAAEQKYFDHVSDHRERMRRHLLEAPGAAANAGAAVRLRKDAEARLQRIGQPDDAVAVGRMDDEDGDVLYVGHNTIFDDDSEVLVVNWQAPAAARYYTATHADTGGLVLKRTFECNGNRIESYSDVVFQQLAAAVAELEAPGDALLDDLNRDRTGQMQDIVRTIQAAQFDLIRAPLDQLLVIQGGPGTGKTAVALHRVSWLLFNYRDALSAADVLIVGPTPTFTRYTRTVLPSLGDISVVQRDIGQFHPPVKRGRTEGAGVVRLKGDGRLAGLLRRALYDRIGVPADQPAVEAQLDGRPVVFTADEINQIVARSRQTPGTFTQQRQIFRSLMVNVGMDRARDRRLGVRTSLDQLIERIWPSFTAPAFLRELFGSRDRLIAAAGEAFTAREVALLHRRPGERITEEIWSEADLPLLDYLESLLHGIDDRYAHIVVDEAQDLSPMQLRSIAARSSTGSMTVVGDIAQSTGLWARDDWDDILEHLPAQLPQRTAELRYGYRVPRQVFELAERLLPIAAPGITPPQVVRDGPGDPVFRLVDDESRAAVAVEAAMAHASHGRSVAIICPAVHRWAIESELAVRDVAWRAASRSELGQGVNLVSPQEAKGLEFDATVVVEPKDIVAEDERGHRLLYVALTRTTRYLHVVGVLPMAGASGPLSLSGPDQTDHVPPFAIDEPLPSGAGAPLSFAGRESAGAGEPLSFADQESFGAGVPLSFSGRESAGDRESLSSGASEWAGAGVPLLSNAQERVFPPVGVDEPLAAGGREQVGDVPAIGELFSPGGRGRAGEFPPLGVGESLRSGNGEEPGGFSPLDSPEQAGDPSRVRADERLSSSGHERTGDVPPINGFGPHRAARDFEVTRRIIVPSVVGTASVPSPRAETMPSEADTPLPASAAAATITPVTSEPDATAVPTPSPRAASASSATDVPARVASASSATDVPARAASASTAARPTHGRAIPPASSETDVPAPVTSASSGTAVSMPAAAPQTGEQPGETFVSPAVSAAEVPARVASSGMAMSTQVAAVALTPGAEAVPAPSEAMNPAVVDATVPTRAAAVTPVPPAVAPPAPARMGSLSAQIVELVAVELASQVRENVQPAQWRAVLDRVGELLSDE
ncbi:UvrD-helicase domain-containing protein [Paractinoplanes hotanensis]|uniref:UvrD-helicase domain-containing protein n=1 Tax=Paractinoplanes hotanensis TaxID=2906497 RepID=A0ABT0Y6D0_9ACTN|nr:UvrD-helicase domain-containing protein [Actinoplanes hotanensis]MCM4080884.1 UvrD-helicase domain-containing protein [Actinoplanes hotanensis]